MVKYELLFEHDSDCESQALSVHFFLHPAAGVCSLLKHSAFYVSVKSNYLLFHLYSISFLLFYVFAHSVLFA